MTSPPSSPPPDSDEQALLHQTLSRLEEQNQLLQQQNQVLQRQLAWFQRQLFGRKSEQRLFASVAEQGVLFPSEPAPAPSASETVDIEAHQRRKNPLPGTPHDSGLRFDESQVPVKTIERSAPQLSGDQADEYEIIRYDTTYRLAQRPGSYVILKYLRPVLKHTPSERLTTLPAPANVLDKSLADVSFIAGLLIDKFVYHLPLYRQHQRLQAAHIELSRATLTHLVHRAAALLEPIAQALLRSILQSHVLAMDETPTRAGRKKQAKAKRGQMRTGYYWPLYGDRDEVYFSFSSTRDSEHVMRVLAGFKGTLLTDGYSAYESYIAQVQGVISAQCWSHSRRYFERALDDEPVLANEALDWIGVLYGHEQQIKKRRLSDSAKLAYRGEHSKAVVDAFFDWCRSSAQRPDLRATESPLLTALNYVLNREAGLRVFLEDPAVAPDTNHLERTLRVIPLGRKNWLFSWSELGARQVGIIQSLLCSCKLQGVDPYTYLVDVMQRISQHPNSRIEELMPRLWKARFADQPLRSDVDS